MSTRSMMRSILFLFFLGCAEGRAFPGGPGTIDQEYVFDDFSCSDSKGPAACRPSIADRFVDVSVHYVDRSLIDIIPNQDGRLDSWRDVLKSIRVEVDGSFHQEIAVRDWTAVVDGVISPEAIRLDFRFAQGAHRQTISAVGHPSGFSNQHRLRGEYVLERTLSSGSPLWCGGRSQHAVADVFEHPAFGVWVVVRDEVDVVGTLSGTKLVDGRAFPHDYGVGVSAEGDFSPAHVEFLVQYLRDDVSCAALYRGAKRVYVPGRTSRYRVLDRSWRVAVGETIDDVVRTAAMEEFEYEVNLVQLDADTLSLKELWRPPLLLRLDAWGDFVSYFEYYSLEEGVVHVRYEGRISTDGRLRYATTSRVLSGEGMVHLIEGRARF